MWVLFLLSTLYPSCLFPSQQEAVFHTKQCLCFSSCGWNTYNCWLLGRWVWRSKKIFMDPSKDIFDMYCSWQRNPKKRHTGIPVLHRPKKYFPPPPLPIHPFLQPPLSPTIQSYPYLYGPRNGKPEQRIIDQTRTKDPFPFDPTRSNGGPINKAKSSKEPTHNRHSDTTDNIQHEATPTKKTEGDAFSRDKGIVEPRPPRPAVSPFDRPTPPFPSQEPVFAPDYIPAPIPPHQNRPNDVFIPIEMCRPKSCCQIGTDIIIESETDTCLQQGETETPPQENLSWFKFDDVDRYRNIYDKLFGHFQINNNNINNDNIFFNQELGRGDFIQLKMVNAFTNGIMSPIYDYHLDYFRKVYHRQQRYHCASSPLSIFQQPLLFISAFSDFTFSSQISHSHQISCSPTMFRRDLSQTAAWGRGTDSWGGGTFACGGGIAPRPLRAAQGLTTLFRHQQKGHRPHRPNKYYIMEHRKHPTHRKYVGRRCPKNKVYRSKKHIVNDY